VAQSGAAEFAEVRNVGPHVSGTTCIEKQTCCVAKMGRWWGKQRRAQTSSKRVEWRAAEFRMFVLRLRTMYNALCSLLKEVIRRHWQQTSPTVVDPSHAMLA
jgi:hypothetical protein